MTCVLCFGLLFDMDGVLVDSTAAVARAWTNWAIKQGMVPEFVIKTAHGRTSLASVQALLHTPLVPFISRNMPGSSKQR